MKKTTTKRNLLNKFDKGEDILDYFDTSKAKVKQGPGKMIKKMPLNHKNTKSHKKNVCLK